jgi:hypothetical protein
MPVDRHTGQGGHAEAHRDIAPDHPAALKGLREEEVVDVSDWNL